MLVPSSRVGYGAPRAIPAAKPKGPLWVQRGDLGRNARQRERRADSRPSRPRLGTGKFDPMRTFLGIDGGSSKMPHCGCCLFAAEGISVDRKRTSGGGAKIKTPAMDLDR
jgi:hypothetical protein